jgi:glycine/D-amino acid oxidase-like deaminating enzyme
MSQIRGRVVDVHGRPVAGAAIYVESAPVALPDIAAMTDDDGGFTLAVPVSGRYRIGANADPHGRTSVDVDVQHNAEDRHIELQLKNDARRH